MQSRLLDCHIAYLGLGSNLGDRAANLLPAISALTAASSVIAVSSIYETEPVDFLDQPGFLNMAVAVAVHDPDPFAFLKFCLDAESRLGRRRVTPKGARKIDIDLLLFDDFVIGESRDGVDLHLPHPRLHLRRFALTPLAEIAPQAIHPVYEKTIKEILEDLDDPASVVIYRP